MTSLSAFTAALELMYVMTVWPGCARRNRSNSGAGQPSESEHPASRSGSSTSLPGLRILAVSAMKCTPQKTMTEASVFSAACASARLSPITSAMSWMSGSW